MKTYLTIFITLFISWAIQKFFDYYQTTFRAHKTSFYISPLITHESILLNTNVTLLNSDYYAPVIGILVQPIRKIEEDETELYNKTYIPTSYVKFIESGGGRAIAIPYDISEHELDNITSYLDGILLPGGSTKIQKKKNNDSNVILTEYAKKIKFIVEKSMRLHDEGKKLPVFGICLGMEGIMLAIDPGNMTITKLETNYSYVGPIGNYSNDGEEMSKLFLELPQELKNISQTENLLYYHHKYGSEILKRVFKPLAYHIDNNNTEFVTSFEGIKYPIYGVQFHPEKILFEWKVQTNRSKDAVNFAIYLSNKFINFAKNNETRFPEHEFRRLSVHNFPTTTNHKSYSQIYVIRQII